MNTNEFAQACEDGRMAFSKEDLNAVSAYKMDLTKKKFGNAILRNARFDRCNATQTNYAGADLNNFSGDSANFTGASFEEANLNDATLDHANCTNALFDSANLRRACFRYANLEGACFANANLELTNFTGATHGELGTYVSHASLLFSEHGEYGRMMNGFKYTNGYRLWCGCFSGDFKALDEYIELRSYVSSQGHLAKTRKVARDCMLAMLDAKNDIQTVYEDEDD